MEPQATGYDLGNGYRLVLSQSNLGKIAMLFQNGKPIWTGNTETLQYITAIVARGKLN